MLTILLVIGILVLLILVHEFGHFLAAKLFRVRVEEFGIGFPPRAALLGKRGDTEYTLNWIPFGGFVKLFGDVGEDRHGKGSFVDKNRAVQAVILMAGVFMNVVIAWALFAGALAVGTPRIVTDAEGSMNTWVLISNVIPGSPAASAGLLPGDRVLEVSGDGATVEPLTREGIVNFVAARGGESVEVTVLRGQESETVTVHPAHAVIPDASDRPAIGVQLEMVSVESVPLLQAMKDAFVYTYHAFGAVAAGLWGMVENAFLGESPLKNLVGPVGLVGVVGAAAESGMGNVLALAGFISINLVIINLLPIPALDGGRLFILGIEAIARRQTPQLATRVLNALSVAFIVFLMVVVTWNDIAQLLA